jgi:integrase
MPRTRTPGITIDSQGLRTINKEYRCVRIFARLGAADQDHAEHRLAQEIRQVDWELERRAHARPLFADCAKRYLLESTNKRSRATIAWHVRMLLCYVGDLETRKVHDETLRPFVEARLAAGASGTRINRTLEIVRIILHRAARAYRDSDGFPWLETTPPLITMLTESPRLPHPIDWEEQEQIFRRLPDHLARMPLFAVNTGLRDSNLCGLQWWWEVPIPEIKLPY